MNLTHGSLGQIADLINDTRLTTAELRTRVQAQSRVLAKLSLAPGARIVIAHGNSVDFFADLFAVWQVGGCAVCVNPTLTASELTNVVDFVEAGAVLVSDKNDAGYALDVPTLCTWRDGATSSDQFTKPTQLDDPALILFTSGTTGTPKGVVHTHRSLQARIALNQAEIGVDTLAQTLCVLPTHFGHGLIGNCLTPLLCGGTVNLFHNAGMAGYAGLAEVLHEHNIQFISGVPTFWKLVLRLSDAPESTPLRRVHIGSAPLGAELWRDVMSWTGTDEVINAYGITETANWLGGANAKLLPPEPGLIGTPWGGTFAVLGEDGELHAEGHGEIAVRSPSLMTGYYQQPELTAQVLRNGWYYTGDIGHIDANGVARMTGRNKFCINLAGIKIYPEELDLLVEQHTDVIEACAFAVPDELSNEVVGIAIHRQPATELDDQSLRDWLSTRIRAEAIPQRVFYVEEIPKNDRGKINRDIVAEHCLQVNDE